MSTESKSEHTGCLHWNSVIWSYRASVMKLPDLGDVSKRSKCSFSGIKVLLPTTGIKISTYIFKLRQAPPMRRSNGAHGEVYWFLTLNLVRCVNGLSVIRPYLCSVLPENAIRSRRFIVDIPCTPPPCSFWRMQRAFPEFRMSSTPAGLNPSCPALQPVCLITSRHRKQESRNYLNLTRSTKSLRVKEENR
jgi:hypothetical protein